MARTSLVLALAASVAAISPAVGADMYGNRAPSASYGYTDPGVSPTSQWNGAYAGAQVGYGWGRRGMNGAQGGLYAGINSTVGSNFVVGGEAEVNLSGQSRSGAVGSQVVESSSGWNGAVRARAGVAFDKIMPYATAGIAFTDDTMKVGNAKSSTTKVGYVVGAGVEGRVTDRISVKGEVLYSGFGDTSHSIGAISDTNNGSTTLLRTGAAYRF